MHVALSLVSLGAAVIAVTGLARRFGLPAPLVLIAVGIVASFVPFVPEVQLTADVVLVGLLPPLLYSTALQASLVDFNTNRRAILLLSIGLVAFTTVGVAVVMHLVLPGIDWPAAFAIGAVVAPPDAVAATAIARRIGMPRSVTTILEGESLLNDATALVALRTAVLAAAGVASVGRVAVDFAVAAGGGLLVGVVTFVVVGRVRQRFVEPVFDTSVSIITPFAAYVAAEQVHASGVLAVVVAGLLLGHKAPILQTASSRIAERLNWRTFSFLLENTVFLLIGLQARRIIGDVADSDLPVGTIVGVCVVALMAVMLLRVVWVLPSRVLLGHADDAGVVRRPPWSNMAVVSWSGMRGVVTLAAAFAIPVSFPRREVLVLVALTVTAGTLFVQGLSLRWLVRRLGVPAPDPRADALARAMLFQKASVAGLEQLRNHAGEDDPHGTMTALRTRAEQRDFAAWERLGSTDPEGETPSEAYARLRLEMLQAERARVLDVRGTGLVPAEVVDDVLSALDVEESMLDVRSRRREELRESPVSATVSVTGPRPSCEHLRDAPRDTEPNVEGACEDCLREGSTWVHLRLCLRCGHVGCCDSSPRRHATAHFHDSGHPVMRSAEPGEAWRWCFVDNRLG